MYATILANAVNIALNYLFMIGSINIGLSPIENIALASVFSFFVGLLYVAYSAHFLHGIKFSHNLDRVSFKNFMSKSFKISGPGTIEPLSYELNRFFITIIVVSLGPLALTTRIYTLNLILLAVIFSQAIGVGNRIICSYHIGANKFIDIEKQIINSCLISVSVSSAILAITWLFSTTAFGVFTKNTDILVLGSNLLLIDLLRHPAGAINMVIVNTLVISGDSKYPIALSVISMWIICLPLVYLLAIHLGLGLIGVWLALLADEYIRCAINVIRWQSRKWKTYASLLIAA
jgi:Na+-driven multidrug efflux pump